MAEKRIQHYFYLSHPQVIVNKLVKKITLIRKKIMHTIDFNDTIPYSTLKRLWLAEGKPLWRSFVFLICMILKLKGLFENL